MSASETLRKDSNNTHRENTPPFRLSPYFSCELSAFVGRMRLVTRATQWRRGWPVNPAWSRAGSACSI